MSSLPQPLLDALFDQPERFAFAQAVDLLEAARKPRARLGQGTEPGAEALRLTAQFGLAFRPGAIDQLGRECDPQGRHALAVNFFGLGDAQGPLPEPYVELILDQMRQGGAAAEFLAIFQHRLLSFVYRGEAEFRVAAPFRAREDSPFMPALDALLGLPERAGEAALADILLAQAGAAVQQRRSMAGLLALLSSHFGVAVRGAEFAGAWIDLPGELRTALGCENDLLGCDTVLGSRAWDQNAAIGLAFDPLPMASYTALLPGGARHHELARICRHYLGLGMRCYVLLELERLPPVPADAGAQDDPYALRGTSCLLGHTCWLAAGTADVAAAERRVMMVIDEAEQEDLA
jgi:type VI secretion system protein ImpH